MSLEGGTKGVDAKATWISDGKVFGTAMWPRAPRPIKFWASVGNWHLLCQGHVPGMLPFGGPSDVDGLRVGSG